MGSRAVIDLERLLAPISDDSPAGEDLRADASPVSAYYMLTDARKAARARERSLGMDEEVPDTRSEWRPVLEQSVELLGTRSKDIKVLAWLLEALVRIEGFAGLRDGFELTKGFIEHYWDDFYPHEESLLDRIAPFSGLNGQDAEGTLIFPIRNVPITEEHSIGPFATWHYQQAVSLQQMADPETRKRRIEAGAATMDQIDKAALESDAAFLKDLYDDLQACRTSFDALTADLNARCGIGAAPPSSNIKNALNTCLEAVQYVEKLGRDQAPDFGRFEHPVCELGKILDEQLDRRGVVSGQDIGDGSSFERHWTGDLGGAADPQWTPAGEVRTREDVLRALDKCCEYFSLNEPSSPVPLLLTRARRLVAMDFQEPFRDTVPEDPRRVAPDGGDGNGD